MRRNVPTAAIALFAGLLLGGLLLAAAGGLRHMSGVPAAAAPPATATYVSELGPASVQPPRLAPALPPSGSGARLTGLPWPRLAGLGLAIAGALLVHVALTMRPPRVARS